MSQSTSATPTLRFTPYDEQRAVLQSDARFRVVAAGRRSGKTIMAAFETLRRARDGGDGWSAYWVGAEHRHADTAFQLIDEAVPDQFVDRRKMSPPRAHHFDNGATLEYHSAGGGANVSVGLDWAVLDEAGKSFPEHVWTAELRPTLSDREGAAMFISTPSGRGWFYRAYERGQSDDHPEWASWRWPTYANPHVADSEIDDAREELPERVFQQEYLAQFISETGGVFADLDDRLFTAEYDLAEAGLPPAPEHEGTYESDVTYAEPPCATGVDIARHEDYRVTITVDSAGRVVYFERKQGEAWPQIQHAVERVADRYPGVVAVDASRDNKLVADLERAGVPIEAVKFSPSRKQDLVENLVATVEAGELTAPEIPQLRHELEVFEYDVTTAGNVRYHAPSNFHDDCVDALALAVDARESAARQAVGTTARVGGRQDSDGDGIDLDSIAAERAEQHQQGRGKGNRWK